MPEIDGFTVYVLLTCGTALILFLVGSRLCRDDQKDEP